MTGELLEQLHASARHFRLGELAMGSDMMIVLIDSIQHYVETGADEETIGTLGPVLSMVMEAQQRGDFLLVADLLEYELVTVFKP